MIFEEYAGSVIRERGEEIVAAIQASLLDEERRSEIQYHVGRYQVGEADSGRELGCKLLHGIHSSSRSAASASAIVSHSNHVMP